MSCWLRLYRFVFFVGDQVCTALSSVGAKSTTWTVVYERPWLTLWPCSVLGSLVLLDPEPSILTLSRPCPSASGAFSFTPWRGRDSLLLLGAAVAARRATPHDMSTLPLAAAAVVRPRRSIACPVVVLSPLLLLEVTAIRWTLMVVGRTTATGAARMLARQVAAKSATVVGALVVSGMGVVASEGLVGEG